MAYPKISLIEKANEFDDKHPFAVIHFTKSKGLLQSGAVNGDNLDYLYPVNVLALSNETDINKAFADVVSTYKNQEDKDINLYDFAVSEISQNDAIRAYKVVNDTTLQPITIFRRASYDSRDVVLERLRQQVRRQVDEKVLEEVKD